jgi:hypothetical protein
VGAAVGAFAVHLAYSRRFREPPAEEEGAAPVAQPAPPTLPVERV